MALSIGILVSGRGSNMENILQAKDLPVDVAVVISDNPRAQALEKARKQGVRAVCIERKNTKREFEEEIVRELAGVDLVVLAGFMRILSPWFVGIYEGRIMNIHPSLLPAFPGLDACRQAIEYGVRLSGCTVHFVDAKMDHGPVILQTAVPVFADDTVESLAERILREEHKLYPQAIRLYAEGRLRIEGRRVRILEG